MFQVTLTKLPSTQCALGISHNHAVMGAGGLFAFVNAWSRAYRKLEIPQPSHNRDSLIDSPEINACPIPDSLDALRLGYRFKTALTAHKPADAPDENQTKGNEVFSIHFSLKILEMLKNAAINGPESDLLKGKIVSGNDVMCAYYLRLVCALRARVIPKGSTIRFAVMVSWQELLSDLLGPRYFGNSASNVVVEAKIEEILDHSFSYSVNLVPLLQLLTHLREI